MVRSIGRLFILIALFAFLVPLSSSAQETTGTITGVVTDESGAVLPGVSVTLTNLRTGRTYDFVTNERGTYVAPLLPTGEYDVAFNLGGFQPYVVKAVRLSVNDRLEIGGKLSVGGVAEVVEVIGTSTQLVQPTPQLQSLVGETQVQELPLNNRNFVQLATLAPGVSSDLEDEVGVGLTSRINISVNGARRNALNWLVDGVSNVDVGSNITLLSTPTLESIEEFKIITSSYAAEWPRSGGGVVNVVTKSGSNRFKGSAYYFMRDDSLNANSWFRNQNPDPNISGSPPALDYKNFGYTLGGPVLKDKMFFFWSQEWRDITRAPASLTANVPNPEWLNNPSDPNYVAPALRDSNAVALLAAWPQPNRGPATPGGPGRYDVSSPNINDTRQEVIRVDYDVSPEWRLTGRFTHDLSKTRELGGLFNGIAVPDVATTDTDVPGTVFAISARTIITSNALNEIALHRSTNKITTTNPEGTKGRRDDYGINIPELFPENNTNRIPSIAISGLSTISSLQLYNIEYENWTLTDNFSYQRGNHSYKAGLLMTWEQKNENAASISQGSFSFVAGGGRTAFQNFLLGNADRACASCSYTEAERDITMNLRFNRYEMYAQDSWRIQPNFTLDYGVRYSLYPPITDENDLLVTFDPAAYDPARAPQFANAAGTLIDKTTGDLLVGVIQGGVNSPYGDGIYEYKKNSIQPRVGFSWDPWSNGTTIFRGAYGLYFDQPLVGIFEQNSFTTPPIVNNVSLTGMTLSNPGAGTSANTTGVRTLQATGTDFENPRTQQWNLTVSRRLFERGAVEVSYVGSRGDNLIRPTNANFAQPVDVVALQAQVPTAVNPARPYRSYGNITMRETTARSQYHGLLTSFRYDGGRNGLLTVNYTFSRNQTDATNDRDAVDIPQNPADPDADYADARTDRRHILSASYVYELPFFRDSSNLLLKTALGGWQVAGITYWNSGQPVSRISVLDNTGRRGTFADLAGDIGEGLRFVGGTPFWFNPAAFTPPADGTFGDSGRAPFRQPGFYKWDLSLSKNFYLTDDIRAQFRADFINAFNQVNWLADPNVNSMDNTCTSSLSTCTAASDRFGQLIAVRAPREIQLGLKLYW